MKMSLFKVRVVHPANTKGNDKHYRHNAKYNVLASEPEKAGYQVRAEFPEVTILSISFLGEVDYLSY